MIMHIFKAIFRRKNHYRRQLSVWCTKAKKVVMVRGDRYARRRYLIIAKIYIIIILEFFAIDIA